MRIKTILIWHQIFILLRSLSFSSGADNQLCLVLRCSYLGYDDQIRVCCWCFLALALLGRGHKTTLCLLSILQQRDWSSTRSCFVIHTTSSSFCFVFSQASLSPGSWLDFTVDKTEEAEPHYCWVVTISDSSFCILIFELNIHDKIFLVWYKCVGQVLVNPTPS